MSGTCSQKHRKNLQTHRSKGVFIQSKRVRSASLRRPTEPLSYSTMQPPKQNLLMQAGVIEQNPGPPTAPCPFCGEATNKLASICMRCHKPYHKKCSVLTRTETEKRGQPNTFVCVTCNSNRWSSYVYCM